MTRTTKRDKPPHPSTFKVAMQTFISSPDYSDEKFLTLFEEAYHFRRSQGDCRASACERAVAIACGLIP